MLFRSSGEPTRPGIVEHQQRHDRQINIIDGLPLLQEVLEAENIDRETLAYFNYTWRDSTKKGYRTHLARWQEWCAKNYIRPLDPTVAQVLKFLRIYFETGVGYGAVNAARCALSLVLPKRNGKTMGENRFVC